MSNWGSRVRESVLEKGMNRRFLNRDLFTHVENTIKSAISFIRLLFKKLSA